MAIQNRTPATGTGAVGASSVSVTLPAGIASGDLLVAFGGQTTSGGFTPPSGWTEVFDKVHANGSHQYTMSYKIADGTESGTVVTWTNTSGLTQTVVMHVVPYYDDGGTAWATPPLDTHDWTELGPDQPTLTADGIVTSVNNALVVFGVSVREGVTGGANFTMSGVTELADANSGITGACLGSMVQATAGATPTISATCDINTQRIGGILASFKLASSGSTPVSATDTQAVAVTETTTLAPSLVVTDTQAITVTETANLSRTTTLAETQAVSVSESATVTESSAVSVADMQAISGSETVMLDPSVTAAETQAVTASESATVVESLAISATDTQALAVTESASVSETLAIVASDSQALSQTEALTLASDPTAGDSQAVTASERAALSITGGVSESLAVSATEVVSVSVSLALAETAAVSGSETATASAVVEPTRTPRIIALTGSARGTIALTGSARTPISLTGSRHIIDVEGSGP